MGAMSLSGYRIVRYLSENRSIAPAESGRSPLIDAEDAEKTVEHMEMVLGALNYLNLG